MASLAEYSTVRWGFRECQVARLKEKGVGDQGVLQARYIPAERIVGEMAAWGRHRIEGLDASRVLILGIIAGAFIAGGALFSLLLGTGVESEGARRLIEGFGFSAGFFFVVLSEAALFTEANVVMPATLLTRNSDKLGVFRFWGLPLIGNIIGAMLFGALVSQVGHYGSDFDALFRSTIDFKLSFQDNGAAGWFEALLSGIAANWLVGMAAFFATMGRTIVGKYIPVLLAVMMFVAAGFQHAPANFGYFSLAFFGGESLNVADAVLWNLIPAGLGNIIGGTFLVALPFWYIWGRGE